MPPFTAEAPEPTEAETGGGGGLWGVVWVSVPLEGTQKAVRMLTCPLLGSTEPAPEQHQENPQEATPPEWPLQIQSRIQAQLSLNFKRQKNHLQHWSNSPPFLRGLWCQIPGHSACQRPRQRGRPPTPTPFRYSVRSFVFMLLIIFLYFYDI